MTVLPTIECINEVLRDSFHWQQVSSTLASNSMKFVHSKTDRVLAAITCWGSTRYHAYVHPKENSQSFDTQQNAMNYVEILAMLGEI